MARRGGAIWLVAALWGAALPGHAAGAVVPHLPGVAAPFAQKARISACSGLSEGLVVRSALPVREGRGTERRRYWRGHYRVTAVLGGGRFLAEPLFRRDDTSGETDRAAFEPSPAEAAVLPRGALRCEAFLVD